MTKEKDIKKIEDFMLDMGDKEVIIRDDYLNTLLMYLNTKYLLTIDELDELYDLAEDKLCLDVNYKIFAKIAREEDFMLLFNDNFSLIFSRFVMSTRHFLEQFPNEEYWDNLNDLIVLVNLKVHEACNNPLLIEKLKDILKKDYSKKRPLIDNIYLAVVEVSNKALMEELVCMNYFSDDKEQFMKFINKEKLDFLIDEIDKKFLDKNFIEEFNNPFTRIRK